MATNEGAFIGTASIDGIGRFSVYKHLPGLPIIVDVAPAESDICTFAPTVRENPKHWTS